MYTPCKLSEMVTSATHKKPAYTTVNGRELKTYAPAPQPNLRGKFKQKGSSDIVANGVVVVNEKTSYITWYKADIESGDALEINGITYLIKGYPENVEMRNRYLILTLERIEGGV